jgi:hypothetical protein
MEATVIPPPPDAASIPPPPDYQAPAAPKTPAYDDKLSPIVGGTLDTFGLTQRPGARSLKDVALNPKGASEHIARLAGTAGLLSFGGAGALGLGLPALAGEVVTAGGLGALEEKAKGGSPTWGLTRDAILTGLTGGAANRVTAWLNKPVEALSGAIKAPAEVLDVIASRLPKGAFFNLPSLSKTPMTAADAVEELSKLKGAAYKQAWAELRDEIGRLDIKNMVTSGGQQFAKIPGPTAAQQFAQGTSRSLPAAPGLARRGAAAASRSDHVREAAEALSTDPIAQDVGMGGLSQLKIPQILRGAKHMIPSMEAIP